MPIRISCGCGKQYNAPDHAKGKHVRCKSCNALISVPNDPMAIAESQPIVAKPLLTTSSDVKTIVARPVAPERQTSQPLVASPLVAQPINARPINSRPVNSQAINPTPIHAVPVTAQPVSRASTATSNDIPASQWVTGGLIVSGCFAFALVGCILLATRPSVPSPADGNAFAGGSSLPATQSSTAGASFQAIPATSQVSGGLGETAPVQSGAVGHMVPPRRSMTRPGVPSKPDFRQKLDGGVLFASVKCNGFGPGGNTEMNIYLPPGQHAEESLPCVLVAPAGTNMLMGASVADSDYHDETLPYAQAGFAVIQYSLDGHCDLEKATIRDLQNAYREFRFCNGGTMNQSFVLDFIESSMLEVDRRRIYAAGHSSAGTVALLAGKNEHRIAGVVAYAPCTDPEAFHKDFASDPDSDRVFPGYALFDRTHSPIREANFFKKPVFLFHARDDSVVDVAETQRYVQAVKARNSQVEYMEVASGDHYDSMIQQGIPAGIAWLKKASAKLQ